MTSMQWRLYINSQHPIIRFTVQRDVNHRLPFSDVLTDKNIPEFPFTTTVHGKSSYNCILTIKHRCSAKFRFSTHFSRQDVQNHNALDGFDDEHTSQLQNRITNQ